MAAPSPLSEPRRLAALERYEILDTEPEQAFDDLARLAAFACQSPISIISLLDAGRQWFKAAVGLSFRETPAAHAICAHTILERDVFVIPDTLADARFVDNPLCVSDPHFRFYAGVQLKSDDGHAIGTLCVLDTVPRANLSHRQLDALRSLGNQVMVLLELRRTLSALRQSEQFANSVVDSSPDCIKILDLEGRILFMNENGQSLMEVSDVSEYQLAPWVDFWTGADRDTALSALDAARNGVRSHFEGFASTLRGTPRWWECIVTPIEGRDGKPARLLSIARDITERRRIEESLRHTAKLESLGLMAGGIAHDFNNLLTGILGNASFLAELAPASIQPFAEQIVRASERAAKLTNQMLAYAGKGSFERVPVNISSEVREIVDILRSLKNVNLIFQLDDHLPMIEGDTGQIQGLIMNLVLNAAESLPPNSGSITIQTCVLKDPHPAPRFDYVNGEFHSGPYVCLEVRDTGSGMSPEVLSKAFDPFFTTKFTGRGLGLAAVLGVARGLNGVLRVRTRLQHGTTFQLLFPVVEYAAAEEEVEPLQADLRGQGTVLVVDDEEMVRGVARVALERQGYQVVVAEDGPRAVETLSEAPRSISLVLLDLTMPGMNGSETLTRLREIRADLPVIVSSGYDESEAAACFEGNYVHGFIRKPYRASTLAERVKAVLQPSGDVTSQSPN